MKRTLMVGLGLALLALTSVSATDQWPRFRGPQAGVIPDENTRFFFVGIDKARFRKPVEPGDQLVLSATLERSFKGIWKFSTVATVDGSEVCSAEMMVAPEAGTGSSKTGSAATAGAAS